MQFKSEIINKMSTQNNIFSILNNIYSTNGKDKKYWKDLLISINNNSSFPGIIEFFNQRIRNEPSNILNLDILDFLIDYGHIDLVRELSKVDLMTNVFMLLRKSSGSGQEVPKKGIYLTKKWFELANNKKENFVGFIKNYNDLQSKGIVFPPPGFKLYTYEQYISIYEINNLLLNIDSFNGQNNNNENDFNNNFEILENKTINIINDNYNNDSSPFEGDSKHNNNDDIPSDDMPKLNDSNKNGYKINLDLMKTMRNDTILVNNDDKMNNQNEIQNNNDFDNNISNGNYMDNRNNNEKEERGKSKFVNPFDDKQKSYDNPFNNKPEEFNPFNGNNDEPMETSVYPDYNEKEINENNKYKNTNFGNNKNCEPSFNNTPYGNKNKMPNENKNCKTIYNCRFKNYIDETYGNNNGNKNRTYNNTFNYNVHNNNYNNYYNNQGNYYNNNQNQNNQMQNNQNHCLNNSNNATFLYKHSWVVKISLYNQWMSNEPIDDNNLEQLKSAIKILINEYDKIESLLLKYNNEGDFESVSIISKIKSDMDQTCYRFEKLISKQQYDDFYSAFDGNKTVYCFNKAFILNYIENSEKNGNKYLEGLKKFGGVMKKGIFAAGKAVKETTVKGINFVKEKVHKDKNNESNNDSNNSNRYNNNNNIDDFTHSSDNYYNPNYNNYNYQNNNNYNDNYNNNYNNINNYNKYNSFNNQRNNYNNQFNNFNNNQNNNNYRNFY